MRVLITGANGFIARNLRQHLSERSDIEIVCFDKSQAHDHFPSLLEGVDWVFHLAGVNRPQSADEFYAGNRDLTQVLGAAVGEYSIRTGRKIPVIFTSSIHAASDTDYGRSKRQAEIALFKAARRYDFPVYIFRLPNVFGKWCRPNYNSVVATFCHNIAHGFPIQVNNPDAQLTLVYVDDVVASFLRLMDGGRVNLDSEGFAQVLPQYSITVGELASIIKSFPRSRETLLIPPVGKGLMRALYSTYLSYLPKEKFVYGIPQYGDSRGVFVEMLKTTDCGQFSFFTARPGVTRGGHYHHTKTEKFLVIKGRARFRFRNLNTGEYHEICTSGDRAEIVETVPGWIHDITNIGDDDLIVMLWANEIFDRERPDTYSSAI